MLARRAGTRVSMSSATRSAISLGRRRRQVVAVPVAGEVRRKAVKGAEPLHVPAPLPAALTSPVEEQDRWSARGAGLLHVHAALRTCDRSYPRHLPGRRCRLGSELGRQLLAGDPCFDHADVQVRCLALPAVTETGSEPASACGMRVARAASAGRTRSLPSPRRRARSGTGPRWPPMSALPAARRAPAAKRRGGPPGRACHGTGPGPDGCG